MTERKKYQRRTSSDEKWRKKAGNIIKAELKRKGIAYAELAELLKAVEVDETGLNVGNKLSRGTFSFIFAMQCFEVMGIKIIRLD